jgi:hypothetical protein
VDVEAERALAAHVRLAKLSIVLTSPARRHARLPDLPAQVVDEHARALGDEARDDVAPEIDARLACRRRRRARAEHRGERQRLSRPATTGRSGIPRFWLRRTRRCAARVDVDDAERASLSCEPGTRRR